MTSSISSNSPRFQIPVTPDPALQPVKAGYTNTASNTTASGRTNTAGRTTPSGKVATAANTTIPSRTLAVGNSNPAAKPVAAIPKPTVNTSSITRENVNPNAVNLRSPAPKDNRLASVDINLKGFVGIGARGGILNWLTAGVNIQEAGAAGLKFIQGKPLASTDKLQVRGQLEFGGLDRLPLGIGNALKRIMPHAEQADAGGVLKINMTGDGKSKTPKLESVEGIIYVDVPNNNGLVTMTTVNGKPRASRGIKPDQGFTQVAFPISWKPGQPAPSIGRPDFINGQITSINKKPKDANNVDVPGFDGWTVVGVTDVSQSGFVAAGLANQGGRLSNGPNSRSNKIISGAVGIGQTLNFFNNVKTALDGRTVEKVKDTMNRKVNYSTTALGVVQGIIKPTPAPVGLYIRGEATITATKDGKDDINLYSSGTKIGTVTARQLQESAQNMQRMFQQIPGFGGGK